MAGTVVRPVLTTRNGEVALSGLRTGARDLAVALHQQISKDTQKARRLGKRIQVALFHPELYIRSLKNTTVFQSIIKLKILLPYCDLTRKTGLEIPRSTLSAVSPYSHGLTPEPWVAITTRLGRFSWA